MTPVSKAGQIGFSRQRAVGEGMDL